MKITLRDYRRTQTKHRKAKKGHGWTKTSTQLFTNLCQFISKYHLHSEKIILSCYVALTLQNERLLLRQFEPKSPFERSLSKRILFFCLFNVFLRFRGQSAKKTCLRFAIFNFSEKLQNIFEIGLRKCEFIVQKSLLKKKYFEIKNSETLFCCLYAKLATVKI